MICHTNLCTQHAYGASKYDSELYCLEQTDIPWIGLPRAVFGKGDETLIPRLERLISDKRYLTVGKGDALIDITCLGNFLDAVVCAIEANDDALHRFYNILTATLALSNPLLQHMLIVMNVN